MQKYIVDEIRLKELLEAEERLASLEIGGVDNWEWYGDSINDNYEEPTLGGFEKYNEIR